MDNVVNIEGLDELRQKFSMFDAALQQASKEELEKLARDTQIGIRTRIADAPRIDTGQLHASINYHVSVSLTGVEAIITPDYSGRHAIFVEENTRPHWPPIAAITPWAERHGIEPFLAARAIAQHGTKGIHMFAEEFKEVVSKGDDTALRIGRATFRKLGW